MGLGPDFSLFLTICLECVSFQLLPSRFSTCHFSLFILKDVAHAEIKHSVPTKAPDKGIFNFSPEIVHRSSLPSFLSRSLCHSSLTLAFLPSVSFSFNSYSVQITTVET